MFPVDADVSEQTISRRTLLGSGGAAIGVALSGCASFPFPDDEDGTPTVLRFALPKPPRTLDPLSRQDTAAALVVRQVAEGLYRYNRGMSIEPLLAATAPEISRGGRRWVVEIDDSARFDADRVVNATDVEYSMREARRRGTAGARSLEMLEEVSAIDERTVQFDLAYGFQGFSESLRLPIVPAPEEDPTTEDAGTIQAAATDPTAALVGSGPFSVEEVTEEGDIRLERAEDYWQGKPAAVDAIEFPVVPDDTKRIVTLRAQEIDATQDVPPSVWQTIVDLEDVSLESVAGYGYHYFAFNCQEGATADPEVRVAIDHAVDFDEVVEAAVGPTGRRIYGPLPRPITTDWAFPRDEWRGMRRELDRDRARTLLEQSDAVPPEWEFRIIAPPDQTRVTICEAIAEGVRETGFEATVERLDWPTMRATYHTGRAADYNAYCLGTIAGRDPDGILFPLFGPGASGVTDGTYYRDATEAVIEGRRATDREDRRRAYEQVAGAVLGDIAHIPLFTPRQSIATRQYVSDVGPHPIDGAILVGGDFNVAVDDTE